MIEDVIVRIAASCQVDGFIDDIFCLYEENVTNEDVNNLKSYLKRRGISIPKSKDSKESLDVIKMMYLAWASLECLELMCELNGEESRLDENG